MNINLKKHAKRGMFLSFAVRAAETVLFSNTIK